MNSILETFYILFESDASNVKKGTQEAKKSTDALQHTLEDTDKIANKIGGSFLNLARQFGALMVTAFSVGAIISGIHNAAEYANSLGRVSRELNINISTLDAWGSAVEKNGGSAQSFQQTLKSLQTNLDFQILGRRLTGIKGHIKDATLVLPRLAELFERLGKIKSNILGQQLGIDQGTISLLQQGRREVETVIARQKELGLVTKEDAEIAAKFNEQWQNTTHAFRSLFMVINSMILPVITKTGKAFEETALFFRRHSDLIKGGIIGIAVAISAFLLPALATLTTVLLPYIAWGALLVGIATAIALVYDDLMVFSRGGDSVLGEMIKKWPALGEVIKAIAPIVKGIGAIFGKVGKDISNIWNDIAEGINAVITLVKALGQLFGWVGDQIDESFQSLKSFFGFNTNNAVAGQNALRIASTSPISSQTSNSIVNSARNSNKQTSVTTGPITINTNATDSRGIAGAIGNDLETQIRQAMATFDDGVEA